MASARRTGTNENISTYGDGTRDYTVLATWEAATDNDLVTAETSEVLECYDDAASFDDSLTAAGTVANSTYMRIIRPAAGQGHDGTSQNGVHFVTTGAIFIIAEDSFKLQDIIITVNSDNATDVNALVTGTGSGIEVAGCIIYLCTNVGVGGANGFRHISGTANYVDCLSEEHEGDAFRIEGGTCTLSNCTAVLNEGFGFIQTGGTAVARNCLGGEINGADFDGTFAAGTFNNASEDGTAPGTDSRTSQTFTFVDANNNDFKLNVSDAGAQDFGADLSMDATFAFDDDTLGEFFGTWDIGFHEPVPGSGMGAGMLFDRLLIMKVT